MYTPNYHKDVYFAYFRYFSKKKSKFIMKGRILRVNVESEESNCHGSGTWGSPLVGSCRSSSLCELPIIVVSVL